jgi:hypothetical protein
MIARAIECIGERKKVGAFQAPGGGCVWRFGAAGK